MASWRILTSHHRTKVGAIVELAHEGRVQVVLSSRLDPSSHSWQIAVIQAGQLFSMIVHSVLRNVGGSCVCPSAAFVEVALLFAAYFWCWQY